MLETIKPFALGLLVYLLIVAGGTYLLQDTLILHKSFDSNTHWAGVLIGLPLIAGLTLKFMKVPASLVIIILGALLSAGIIYPFYGIDSFWYEGQQRFWGEPPSLSDMAIYTVIVLGISYMANQPLKATFMMAFSLFKRGGDGGKPAAKPAAKAAAKSTSKPASSRSKMSQTQRIRTRQHGDVVALVELLVGLVSLVLSVFSIFFLGQGG